MFWLENRRAAKQSTPGVYLCWELMVGNSNCRWYWGTPPDAPEPTVPWCGLLWPDATPVSLAEAEAVRRYVTGKGRALFFDDLLGERWVFPEHGVRRLPSELAPFVPRELIRGRAVLVVWPMVPSLDVYRLRWVH